MVLREWWLWALGAGLLWRFPPWTRARLGTRLRPAQRRRRRRRGISPGSPCVLRILNGLTPYLGVQYQHAGAMVSNLRIDRGCWNHVFVPESGPLTDDYIRVDEVYFGEPGRTRSTRRSSSNSYGARPSFGKCGETGATNRRDRFTCTAHSAGASSSSTTCAAGEVLPFATPGYSAWRSSATTCASRKTSSESVRRQCIH